MKITKGIQKPKTERQTTYWLYRKKMKGQTMILRHICRPITCLHVHFVLWYQPRFPCKCDDRFVWKGFMVYLCYLNLFTGVQCDFYIRWYSCCSTVTRRVLLVQMELFSISFLNTSIHTSFSLGFVMLDLKFSM